MDPAAPQNQPSVDDGTQPSAVNDGGSSLPTPASVNDSTQSQGPTPLEILRQILGEESDLPDAEEMPDEEAGVPSNDELLVNPAPVAELAHGGNDTPAAQPTPWQGHQFQPAALPQPPAAEPEPELPPKPEPEPDYGNVDKERVFGSGGEKVPLVEVQEEEKIPEDVQAWVERIQNEDAIKLPQPVKDGDDVVMTDQPVTFVDDKIVIPLTAQGLQTSLQKPVIDSGRWLAEWCMRLIKMFKDRVQYKE